MSTSETPTRDAKLAQYLSEALGNEKRLETALQAHIGMATRASYKRRLRQHLSETRRHATALGRRIKQLGGSSDPIPGALGDAAGAVLSQAQKATALAQGPLHALRRTGEAERQLKNAKTEYAEEAQEIGMYSAIEALAVAVSDAETARLAREILRDERRMLTYLEREIPRLTAAVARAEIPASQLKGARAGRSRTARGTRARASSGAPRDRTPSGGSARNGSASLSATRRSAARRSGARPSSGSSRRAASAAG
jgi:ferritin-like metal-binding protein YciE